MKLIIDIEDEALERLSIADPNLLYTAIKNGKPYKETTSGDLISREALKKALQEYKQTHYDDERPDLEYEYIDIDDLNYAIDNAPTVEDRYDEGYAQGYLDGSTGADWRGEK